MFVLYFWRSVLERTDVTGPWSMPRPRSVNSRSPLLQCHFIPEMSPSFVSSVPVL